MLRAEYIIKRSGRDYVLYPGLLNEAHHMYESFTLDTEVLENRGDQPLVKATFVGWIEGIQHPRKTQGHGTAGRPSDKSGAAAEAPLEMAETRAKARALRDAVNIGETAFEELSHAEPETPRASSRRAHEPKRRDPASPDLSAADAREKISEETLDAMKVILFEDAKYKNVPLEDRIKALEDYQGYPLDQMSEETARGWIAQFEQMLRHRKEIDRATSR